MFRSKIKQAKKKINQKKTTTKQTNKLATFHLLFISSLTLQFFLHLILITEKYV